MEPPRPPPGRRVAALLVLAGLGLPIAPAAATSTRLRVLAGVGVSARDGGLFSTLDAGLDAARGAFSASLRLPGQLLVTGALRRGEAGLVRSRDWDERAEWLRLLPHFGWRHRDRRGGTTSLVIGPLAGVTLGHGTVVDRYYGALLPDRFQSGARLRVRRRGWALDAITEDVTAARILAGRVSLRPMAARRRGIARTLELGATLAVDRRAPLFASHTAVGARRFTAAGELIARRTPVTIAGLDLAIQPLRSRTLSLVPYVDLGFTALAGRSGPAAHAGLRATLWPGDRHLGAGLRYELRSFDGAALPTWFDTLYEVEQARWLGPGPLRTKAEAAIARPGGVVIGHLLSAHLRVRDAVLAAVVQLHPGAEGLDSFAAWLTVPWSERLTVRAMAARRRFTAAAQLIGAANWTAAAAVLAEIAPPFSAYLELQRAWHVGTSPAGLHTSWDGALGVALRTNLGG